MDKRKTIKRILLRIYCKMFLMAHKAGCHQLAERSFFYKSYQFPMCARCTGVMLGYVLAFAVWFVYRLEVGIYFALCLLMFFDWYLQYLKIRTSTNVRRLLTGIGGGIGLMSLFLEGILWFGEKL